MSRYKRLKLCSMFKNVEFFEFDIDEEMKESHFIPVHPIFNRDGWYYDRKTKACWYEHKGRGWTKSDLHVDFLYELDQLNTRWLEKPEIEAIKTLRIYGSCPKNLLHLLWKHEHNQHLVEIKRSVYQFTKQILGD